MNKDIDVCIKDQDYQNIMEKACVKFRCVLSRDEIESIKLTSLWRALDRYDDNRGTKFTSYLYRGTYLECKTYANFVVKGRKADDKYFGQYHSNLPDVEGSTASVELIEELQNIDGGFILIESYYNKMKPTDICEKYNITVKEINRLKKKALRNLEYRLN